MELVEGTMTILDDQQFSRLMEGIDRIGSELNQLTSALSALGSCIGGINYTINDQTHAINDLRDKISNQISIQIANQTEVLKQQGESLKDSITDLTMHVAMRDTLDHTLPGTDDAQ